MLTRQGALQGTRSTEPIRLIATQAFRHLREQPGFIRFTLIDIFHPIGCLPAARRLIDDRLDHHRKTPFVCGTITASSSPGTMTAEQPRAYNYVATQDFSANSSQGGGDTNFNVPP